MKRPSVEVDPIERLLDSTEAAGLRCSIVARKTALDVEGVIIESEVVSHHEAFGYVYRYDMVKIDVDDGKFHPDAGTKGAIYKIETKLILYSLDGVHFHAATHPKFELPSQ